RRGSAPVGDARWREAVPRRKSHGDRLQASQGGDPAAARRVHRGATGARAAARQGARGPLPGGAARRRGARGDARRLARARSAGVKGAESILAAPTPPEWLAGALARWEELLIDHANCEKKAASSALALMFAYPEDRALATALARLAREELRHFEQVSRAMAATGVTFKRQRP